LRKRFCGGLICQYRFRMGQPGPQQRSKPLLRRSLGKVLRRIRLEQRRTLADVARAAKVSMPYLSELERGRKEASSEVLAAICAALSIDLAEVLAQVGRELTAADVRLAPVIRLHSIDSGRADQGGVRGNDTRPASPTCLLAA
jgi:transcriptional regulator with XRE-family HTH domain